MLLEEAVSRPGLRWVNIREVQKDLAHSVRQLIVDKLDAYGVRNDFLIPSDAGYIKTPGGGLMLFQGMQNHTADSIKSLEGFDGAWLEEAQTISARSLELLRPTLRKPGSQIWASWNPDQPTDPVDDFFRSNPPTNAISVEVNWQDNPWFPDELREDMLEDYRRNPDRAAHVWGGHYRGASEARIFRNVRQSDITPPDNVVWFYGADWGFSVDPLAAVRLCIVGRTLYISDEVYEVGVPTERVPIALATLPNAAAWPMVADNARPETIDYVRRHGFPRLRPATKGQGSIEDGISFLQGFDIVVSPRCPNVWHEFQNYAYKTDRQTGEILPVPEDDHNHAIDAIRYATERLHRKGKLLIGEAPVKRAPRDYGSGMAEDVDGWKVA